MYEDACVRERERERESKREREGDREREREREYDEVGRVRMHNMTCVCGVDCVYV